MDIKGIQKTSMIDYPGKMSAIIFLPKCTFRCGFCHNVDLVTGWEKLDTIDEREALNFLKDRKLQEKYMNLLLALKPRHENYRLWRAIALARWGDSKEEAWREFERIPPRKSLAYNRACFYGNVAENDKALELLRTAIELLDDIEARNRQRLWAASDDEFRALRNDPRFREIVKPEEGR